MKKNKKLILGIVLGVLLISGITYAILTWTSDKINIGLTSNCFTIDYTKGNDINNTTINLLNEEDLISNNKFTIKEGMALTYANIGIKSSCTIEGYGILKLNITSLSDAFTTGDSKGSLKYAVLKNTSSSNTITVDNLKEQAFDLVARGSITKVGTIDILTEQLSNTELYKYLIVVYIDNSLTGNDVIRATFNGNISAEAYQGKLNADYTLQRLNNLNSSIVLDTTHTPDFSTVSGNNGEDSNGNTGLGDGTKGIYSAEDDFGTSYYFRGAVENNYVKFGNYYWRIIRINGDGSIRMIYAGTKTHANGEIEPDSRIGTSVFNSESADNTYVGYMYGTSESSTYEQTHANTNDSTIKAYIDNWYQNSLSNYSYAIADTIYCNDRSVTPVDSFAGMTLTGTGIGTEDTAYSNLTRNWINHTPSLKCTNKNDRFTVENDIGNKALTYPVGLITSDEAAMAGEVTYDVNTISYITNIDYYLFTGYSCWTMTPNDVEGGSASVANFSGYGDYSSIGGNGDVRPVVSLKFDAISGGSGTMNDPFTVG